MTQTTDENRCLPNEHIWMHITTLKYFECIKCHVKESEVLINDR